MRELKKINGKILFHNKCEFDMSEKSPREILTQLISARFNADDLFYAELEYIWEGIQQRSFSLKVIEMQ